MPEDMPTPAQSVKQIESAKKKLENKQQFAINKIAI
jgi:hypothetical protein